MALVVAMVVKKQDGLGYLFFADSYIVDDDSMMNIIAARGHFAGCHRGCCGLWAS